MSYIYVGQYCLYWYDIFRKNDSRLQITRNHFTPARSGYIVHQSMHSEREQHHPWRVFLQHPCGYQFPPWSPQRGPNRDGPQDLISKFTDGVLISHCLRRPNPYAKIKFLGKYMNMEQPLASPSEIRKLYNGKIYSTLIQTFCRNWTDIRKKYYALSLPIFLMQTNICVILEFYCKCLLLQNECNF